MIDSRELRIGNWVFYKREPIIVTMVGQYGIQSTMDGRTINAKFDTPDITPIPITQDILLACGFEEHKISGKSSYKLIYENVVFLYEAYRVDIGIWGEANVEWFAEAENVHQLQNVFFSLFQKELQINLVTK